MKKAILVLADGTVFNGRSIGAIGHQVGEVVFNTSLTGYQEILTDPSYAKQIITLTYPHIGNVGVNNIDWESSAIHASGLVVRDASIIASSFRSQGSLSDFLIKHNVIGISDIDTRKLTRILRDNGVQNGCILAVDEDQQPNIEQALSYAREFGGLKNLDLARLVTTDKVYSWSTGKWSLSDNNYQTFDAENSAFHVVAYDFGIKHNILRKLTERNCKITVVPAMTPISEVLALNPDGVFLSNGPGDPEPCDYAIAATKTLLEKQIPLFGICLGMQILGLASGAKTIKMKFGHHGGNHPVENVQTKKVFITSQNHGFSVDENTLPANVLITHRSLFDGSLQGIKITDAPAFAFQGHPEASPGPQDIDYLFDDFIDLMHNVAK